MSKELIYNKYNKAKKSLEELLVKNSPDLRSWRRTIKNRLIKDGVLVYECSIKECPTRNMESWLGKDIPLDLDHVDGDRTNNELSNLRLLCKICHGQTETFAGKLPNELLNTCNDCGRRLYHKKTAVCEECLIKSRGAYKLSLLDKSVIERMIACVPVSEIAKYFNIHLYQVNNYLYSNGIALKGKGFWLMNINKPFRLSMEEFIAQNDLLLPVKEGEHNSTAK